MIKGATLDKQERQLVRKIIDLQLKVLMQILARNSERDITMHCLINDIDQTLFDEAVQDQITLFEKIKKDPGLLFSLDEDNQMIIKNHMFNLKSKKLLEAQSNIWRKFKVVEKVSLYSSLN